MPSSRSSTVRSPAGEASIGTWVRPRLSTDSPTSLLDIGCGGGDVPVLLARWAARDGLRLEVTAIDPDPRASLFARGRHASAGVTFRQAAAAELRRRGPPVRPRGVQPCAAPSGRIGSVPCGIGPLVPRHGDPQRPPPQSRGLRALLRRLLGAHGLLHPAGRADLDPAKLHGRRTGCRRSPGWTVARHAPFRNLLLLDSAYGDHAEGPASRG